jgi:hypothetical protein
MMNLWHWLCAFATTRIHEAHLCEYGSDTKCPRCYEWQSVTKSVYRAHDGPRPHVYVMLCAQCDEESLWSFEAPVPVWVGTNKEEIQNEQL